MFCLRNIPIFYQVHKTDIWKLLLSLYHGEQYEESAIYNLFHHILVVVYK